jgi:predicted RNA binding protein YcfA (HicA-like mRNA interferase family)
MAKFPVDAPRDRVLRALQRLGFELIREGNHIALARTNEDGTRTSPHHAQPSADQGVNVEVDSQTIGNQQGRFS